jgi:hypothetical protein
MTTLEVLWVMYINIGAFKSRKKKAKRDKKKPKIVKAATIFIIIDSTELAFV